MHKSRRRKYKKPIRQIFNKKIWKVVFAGIILLVCMYGAGAVYYHTHFFHKTSIVLEETSIAISGKTPRQAQAMVADQLTEGTIVLLSDDAVWKTISRGTFGIKADFSLTDLESALSKQNSWGWIQSLFHEGEDLVFEISHDEAIFTNYLESLKEEIEALNDGREITSDAVIVKQNSEFILVEEHIGTNLDIEKVMDAIRDGFIDGAKSVELEDYQAQPQVTGEDETIKEAFGKLNRIININAKYILNGEDVHISKEALTEWILYEDGEISLDIQLIEAYLEGLNETYSPVKNPLLFESTLQGEVEVPSGSFGWLITVKTEAEILKNQILEGKDFTGKPKYSGGQTPENPVLLSNTYIEVDLTNQHMWYYIEGELVLETPIVSGKPSTPTPVGVFYVWNKEEDAILEGETYETPVAFWMPIEWTGIGIHDSAWQSSYGEERYQTHGSHGCINTPPEIMEELFERAEIRTPVIVY